VQQTTVIARPDGDQLAELRAHADELKLRASDLEVRKGQLGDQRNHIAADVAPAAIDKQLADVEHELASTHIALESTNRQIHDAETARDMARVGITVQSPMPPEPLFGREQFAMTGTALFTLLIPIVLAYARRIWIRSGRAHPAGLEDSQRLQRMEQAIESIALEVERIGEAQRFTTKLLADRQPDAVARIASVPRREPGTITPH
jgi:hypothetical protein